jgi:hypothetical protein
MKIPNWDVAVSAVRDCLRRNPNLSLKAREYGGIYRGKRGLMVVDVVASRQRKYDTYVVPKILPLYESKASNLSLLSLSSKSPKWLPLREGEADTMKLLAEALIDFGESKELTDEEQIVKVWAEDEAASQEVLDIKGIGPALLQYLRMRSGADSLKVDVRVIEELSGLGIPAHWFTSDGLLELCKEIAREARCSLLELDQVLWHRNAVKK